MGVAGDYVAFWIETVAEQIAPNAYLSVNASAAAQVPSETSVTLAFPLAGDINYCVTKSAEGSYEECSRSDTSTHVSCSSGQVILMRR